MDGSHEKRHWVQQFVAGVVLLTALCSGATAADPYRPEPVTPLTPNDHGTAVTEATRETITKNESYGYDQIGDSVDNYTGRLAIRQTDLVLPGTGPDIRIEREWLGADATYASANLFSEFADWALNIPRIEGAVPVQNGTPNWPNNRCSGFDQIDFTVSPWPGALINLGFSIAYGQKQQPLVRAASSLLPKGTVAATNDFVAVSCVPTIANGPGEGFLAKLPDGTQILFGQLKFQSTSPITYPRSYPDGSYDWFPRARAILYATQVTDRFGNHIDYHYDANGLLTSITGSDGRSVSFTWEQKRNEFPFPGSTFGSPSFAITSMTANGKTWNYQYDEFALKYFAAQPIYGHVLRQITRPDSTQWTFHLTDVLEDMQTGPLGGGGAAELTVTSPSNALAKFVLNFIPGEGNFPRADVPIVQYNNYADLGPNWSFIYANFGMILCDSKNLTGPGLPGQMWTYSRVHYPDLKGWYHGSTPGPTEKVVTTTSPEGVVDKYTYSMLFDASEGNLLKHETFANSAATSPITSRTYTYTPGTSVGTTANPMLNGARNAQAARLSTATMVQEATTYTTKYTTYDAYNNPTTIVRSNSFTNPSTEIRTYRNITRSWVLGLLETSALNSVTSESYTFWPSGQINEASAFGQKIQSFTYNPDGTLASRADGNGHSTSFSDYYRGVPRTTTYADATKLVRTVNDDGTVATAKSPRGYTTSFGYDALGRLTSVAYPAGDSVIWSPQTITYTNLAAAELGMPIGTRRVRTTEGTLQRSDYLDGLLRLVLREEKDTASGNAIYFRTRYDSAGRVAFQSYPSDASAASAGITTSYDAIGRLRQRTTTNGVTVQDVQYFGNNSLEVTDASGNATIYTYQASGAPEQSRVVRIEMKAENQTTAIQRDVFGHVLSVEQSGVGPAITRTYLYDANMRLCKVIEPESGQTVTAYDAASQVIWTASGQNGSATTCDYASVPASQKTSYTYSDVGRQTGIAYGDATGNVVIGYDDDGNMTSTSNPSTSWTWTYNRRGLLAFEQAVIDGQTFTLTHNYNTQGSPSSLTYPDGTSLTYAPDAWGRPTQLGSWASTITYFPNNIPHTYTLGSGASYAADLDARQWLKSSTLTKGQALQAYTYGYNNDGDLTSIVDGVTGTGSATLSYDGLHRLSGAVGCWGSYGYAYDSNNNITERIGTKALSYTYESNRLARIVGGDDIFADGFDGGSVACPSAYAGGPATFAYDARGRRTSGGRLGSANLTWNLANQLVNIQGQADYSYDGRGTRIKSVATGQTEYALYDKSGALVFTQKGSVKTNYVALAGRPLASLSGGAVTYLHPDLLGSPRVATDANGQVAWRANYDPFGVRVGGGTEKLGYTGHALDATGLTYMKARYYDAAVGRFLTTDPKQFDPNSAASFNRYAYANNAPYRYVDPDGKQSRDLEYIWRTSGATSPPQSPDDWLGPAIGGALSTALAPAAGYGAIELGWAVLANPVTTTTVVNTIADIGAGEALGGTSLVVGASALSRAKDVQAILNPRTQRAVTTAVAETEEGIRVFGSSEGALRPAQRAALQPGEVAAKGVRGTHAEINAVNGAREQGLTPTSVSPSRPACSDCRKAMEEQKIPIQDRIF
jgi:RHS repeat-associated protein